MESQAPKHPNGDCEACGAPCAVYGPKYCPKCYWPNSIKDRIKNRQFSNISDTCTAQPNEYGH